MDSRNPVKSFLPRRIVRWIIPFWTIVLIAGSLSPGTTKNAIGSTRIGEPGAPTHTSMQSEFKHQMFHWLAFGLTAYLFLCVTDTAKGEVGAAAGAAGLGIAIELAQIVIYHSGIEWDDVASDVLAASAVYLLVVAWSRFAGSGAHKSTAGTWPREQERHARRTAPDAVSTRLDR